MIFRAELHGRPVALKLSRPRPAARGLSFDTFVPALWGERAVVDLTDHERIVTEMIAGEGVPDILAHGIEAGMSFLASVWIPDASASHRLSFEPRTRFESVQTIALQILLVLARAHAAGVVHRDVTPSNILVQSDGSGLRAWLIDWELATLRGRGPLGPVGTSHYLAPEQVALRTSQVKVDARADLYALGATLYHLACGQPPFPVAPLHHHVLTTLTPIGARCPDIPEVLARAIDRALEKDPERRPQSAEELLAHFEGRTFARTTARPLIAAPTLDRLDQVASALDSGELVAVASLLSHATTLTSSAQACAWSRLWYALGDTDAASMFSQAALGFDERCAEAMLLLARALCAADAFAPAHDLLLGASLAEAESSNRPSWQLELALQWADLWASVGDPLAAIPHLREALRLDPKRGEEGTVAVIDKMLRSFWRDPNLRALSAMSIALTLLGAHRCARRAPSTESAAIFRIVAELDVLPSHDLFRLARSLCMLELGPPFDGQGLSLARSVAAEHRFDLAAAALVAPVAPEDLESPGVALVVVALELGLQARAEVALETLGGAERELAAVWLHLHAGNLARAERALDSLDPAATTTLRASVLLNQHRPGTARSFLEGALAEGPVPASVPFQLAIVFERLGHHREALEHAREAVERMPAPATWRTLSRLAARTGDLDTAVRAALATPDLGLADLETLAVWLEAGAAPGEPTPSLSMVLPIARRLRPTLARRLETALAARDHSG